MASFKFKNPYLGLFKTTYIENYTNPTRGPFLTAAAIVHLGYEYENTAESAIDQSI
jgi:hypothetical protein